MGAAPATRNFGQHYYEGSQPYPRDKATPGMHTTSAEMASFENGSLLPFQQHWKVQYVGKIYGNFRHKDSGGANAAQAKATRFMKPVDKLLAEYDSCKNAAARATWLEPHKMKTKGSIAALREGFLQHICNCKSPVLESTLGETLPAPGSLPVGEGPGGKGAFFCTVELLHKKHPYVTL